MSDSNSIVIVGAGPIGLTAAILLRLRGYDPVVLDRRTHPDSLPAAHVINTRTMEIFSEIGVASTIMDKGDPAQAGGLIAWVECMAGREYGRLPVKAAELDERGPVSCLRTVNLAQTQTEAILRERLEELGGKVQYGQTVTSVEQADDQPVVHIHDAAKNADWKIAADWVIGCDGAGSTVRKSVGIEMEGPPSIARFMTIYFNADLDAYRDGRRAILYWIGGKDARGVFISFDTVVGRTWAMLVPIGDLPNDHFDKTDALNIVRKAIGDSTVPVDIFGLGHWNMSAQVANAYRKGRVLLAGDACHRFPPMGGLGMNTGIQDAHNLAWKLASVIEGLSSDDLLDTYEEERRPIARFNTDLSVSNLMKLGMIDEALGVPTLAPIDAGASKGDFEAFSSDILGIDGDSEDATARRTKVQHAIDQQVEHFAQGSGTDLGFSYNSGAFVPDGSPPPSSGPLNYRPDAHPGARLPFASSSRAFGSSSLGQVNPSGVTLFSAAPQWAEATSNLAKTLNAPLQFISLNTPEWKKTSALQLFGIGDSGAVAVRPDGHVLWRATSFSDLETENLSRAIRKVFDLS